MAVAIAFFNRAVESNRSEIFDPSLIHNRSLVEVLASVITKIKYLRMVSRHNNEVRKAGLAPVLAENILNVVLKIGVIILT